MDINKFMQTDKGRYVMIALVICSVALFVYFRYLRTTKVITESSEIERVGDIDVGGDINDFKKHGTSYYESKDKKDKILRDDEFFSDINASIDRLKEANEKKIEDEIDMEAEYQRFADSVIAANNLKVEEKKVKYATRTRQTARVKVRVEPPKEPQKRRKEGFSSTLYSQQITKGGANSSLQIRATVLGNQKVVDDDLVKVRTTQSFLIEGETIPSGTILYCNARVGSNKVNLNLFGINTPSGNSIPVNLSAYSLNGISGFNVRSNAGTQTKNVVVNDVISEATNGTGIGRRIASVFKRNEDQGVTVSNGLKMILR